MKPLELPRPHPFLIWKGKQTSVVSDKELETGKTFGLICEEQIYGEVILKNPAKCDAKSLKISEKEHCVRENERKLWWPDADILYIYPISFKKYDELLPVKINSQGDIDIVYLNLSDDEKQLIEDVKFLPKVIDLDHEVISMHGEKVGLKDLTLKDDVAPILEAVFSDRDLVFEEEIKGSKLPLYKLSLVRDPRAIYLKKSKDDAPNYRPAEAKEKSCAVCSFNFDGHCELYDFNFDKGHVCDSFELRSDATYVALFLSDVAQANIDLSDVEFSDESKIIPPNEWHITLVYFQDEVDLHKVKDVINSLTDKLPPITGEVNGYGRFNGQEQDAVYGNFDSPELSKIRQVLVSKLEERGILYSQDHGFVPHITFAYIPKDDETPQISLDNIPIEFDELSLVNEGKFIDFPFIGKIESEKMQGTEESLKVVLKEVTMPYKKTEKDSGWCVKNTDTGKEIKCYTGDNAENKADSLLTALRINVEASEKSAEGQKRSISEWVEMIIAMFYREFDWMYAVIDVEEDHIIVTKNFDYFKVPFTQDDSNIDFALKDDWILVEKLWAEKSSDEDTKEETSDEEETLEVKEAPWSGIMSTLGDIKNLLGNVFNGNDTKEIQQPNVMVKEVDGEPWFFMWGASAFQDRDGEFFSTKALEKYVAENEKNTDKGFFNLWHIPGTDFAVKRWQGVLGRILVEAGPFLKDGKGQKAKEFFMQYPESHPEHAPEGWGGSVEYIYLPEERKEKVYNWTWIKRTSVLAKSAASNMVTRGLLLEKEASKVAITDKQKQVGNEVFGKELFSKILKQAEAASDELEKTTAFKEKNPDEVNPDEVETSQKTQPEETTEDQKDQGGDETIELGEEVLANVVAAIADKIEVDLSPIQELTKQVQDLQAQVNDMQKKAAMKEKTEMPRYVVSLQKKQLRASEAEETVVNEKDQKGTKTPKQAPVDGAGAAHFFGNK